MPQFIYRGRDKEGNLRNGTRFAATIDTLNAELINEGIFPFQISAAASQHSYLDDLQEWFQANHTQREELSIFSRQMKLLHQAGVPMTTAFKQLSEHTRSKRFANALEGVVDYLEKGQSLANSMQMFPKIFSPLIVNIIRIGENTGNLSDSFKHIHEYLEFESKNINEIKTAFRYPLFVLISTFAAIIVLNIFVIPSFGSFYTNLSVSLPWQTQLLIGSSNFIVHYGWYLLAMLIVTAIAWFRYLETNEGSYRWSRFVMHLPMIGKLVKRIILIRFSKSLSIMLISGISITKALALVNDTISSTFVNRQISQMQETIERGTTFTNALAKVELFTPLEVQILSVGEKNGELSPALTYIANFHSEEIEFDLKRMSDLIGPILIAIVSGLVLIIALGVYLPIWNMINLVH